MFSYLIRRLFYAVPILFGVMALTFILFRLLQSPQFIATQAVGAKASQAAKEEFIRKNDLDKPRIVQLWKYVGRCLTFEFGESWKTSRSVSQMFREGVTKTLLITLPGFAVGLIAALALALYQVFVRNSMADRVITFFCVALMSIPTIVYIIFCQAVVALQLNWFPVSGYQEWSGWAGAFDTLKFVMLPIAVLAIVNLGYDGRMFRAVFIEEIQQDYVRTAMSKGISGSMVLAKHVLKNGMIAIITLVVARLPALIMGSILIEAFFGIPGMGNVLVLAMQQGDQPVVMASVYLGALLYVFALALTDILYAVADPRIRLS